MIHCNTCTSRIYCERFDECRVGIPLMERVAARPPVPLPVDVPDPAESVVEADPVKPPAPINEPKGPMSTVQEATVRTRWQLIGLAAINAVLAAIGLTGADFGPVLDAVVLGDWGNAVLALIALLGAAFAGKITRAAKGA